MREFIGYEIIQKISRSESIEIYRVRESVTEKKYVIKFVASKQNSNQHLFHLRNEYKILKLFGSDHIVKPYDFQNQKDGYCLIMEDGGISLKEILHRKKTLSLQQFVAYAIEITKGLADVHKNKIVHKDIKPSNVVIQENSDSTIKLIDFGISTRLKREETGWKSVNILEGSLPYISPEQTGRVNHSIDYRTDFYSLGVTFFELLAGNTPFETNDPIELIHSHIAKSPPKIHEVRTDVPEIISKIIFKLMEKDPEKRYNSAFGIKHDLEKSLELLGSSNTNGKSFRLGKKDLNDVFKIPQKLYGRSEETSRLISIFDQVASGSAKLLLVSGYSGIGKSAFIHETHKPITEKHGFFIQGKFDQFQRNIPFSALLIAFRELMHFLLAETEDSLNHWREELDFALGKNAQVLIDVIPELELIIGKKLPVPVLSPAENQNRFNLTFQNFISVFNKKEHPIVLFIDDLQWADISSLSLIKLIMTNSDNKYFMIIGAYRDNEVKTGHPLLKTVEEINKSGLEVENIRLNPLTMDNIQELISDTFDTKQGVEQLAEILIQKTGGNPFFIGEFLKSLYKAEIIDFNYKTNEWQWDSNNIHSYGITDNVVDLMVKNIRNFPENTSKILSLAACLGNQFDIKFLSIISELSYKDLIDFLWPAIEEGVIIPIGNAQSILQAVREEAESIDMIELEKSKIRFQHDRVQQAAYSLIDDRKKKEVHYKAGISILAKVSEEEKGEKLFEITRHLNEGRDLISSESERIRLVQLNLQAGQKAKLATAYESAVNILLTAKDLLKEEDWDSQYSLVFSLHTNLIESFYLSDDLEQSQKLLEYCYVM
ncbi:MAG: serine/threonine-protein kinase PknK [Spirochaetota bacterium]